MENLRDSPSGSGKPRGFLIAAYGSAFRPVTECVEDQENIINSSVCWVQNQLTKERCAIDLAEKHGLSEVDHRAS